MAKESKEDTAQKDTGVDGEDITPATEENNQRDERHIALIESTLQTQESKNLQGKRRIIRQTVTCQG
eukprot:9676299-Ditylum_brightwellii.AAC.1